MNRILIVDDTATSREALTKLLRREGFETDSAMNGAEGLVRLKRGSFDLILLDHMMPEVDGLTFLAGIRRFPKWKDLPVIMFTALKDKNCHTRAQTLGVREFLVKAELTTPQLIEFIRKHLPNGDPSQTSETLPGPLKEFVKPDPNEPPKKRPPQNRRNDTGLFRQPESQRAATRP